MTNAALWIKRMAWLWLIFALLAMSFSLWVVWNAKARTQAEILPRIAELSRDSVPLSERQVSALLNPEFPLADAPSLVF